jgi:hypothetical protein
MSSKIARLSKLRRLYCTGLNPDGYEAFISRARTLAEACSDLTMIVNMDSIYLPYSVARISRTETGEVRSIDLGRGYGMQIGSENEAFPA